MTVLAVLAAAGAAALAVRHRPRPHLPRPGRTWSVVVLVGAVLGVVVVTVPRATVLVVLGAAAGLGAWVLVRRRAHDKEAAATSARVLEMCELLAAELASGQPPGRALGHAATAWPVLRPVVEAHDLGGDVAAALRAAGTSPGADDLRLLAASWAVAHRTGDGLVDAVRRCAESIRAAHASRRLVRGELASARATVRLVAGLPMLALLVGSGAGGDPIGFLLGHPIGLACLGAGLAFGFAGLWWIEAIADDVDAI